MKKELKAIYNFVKEGGIEGLAGMGYMLMIPLIGVTCVCIVFGVSDKAFIVIIGILIGLFTLTMAKMAIEEQKDRDGENYII